MTEWKEAVLQDIAYEKPTKSISNGTKAKKVPMELLEPFTKRVSGYQIEEYNTAFAAKYPLTVTMISNEAEF